MDIITHNQMQHFKSAVDEWRDKVDKNFAPNRDVAALRDEIKEFGSDLKAVREHHEGFIKILDETIPLLQETAALRPVVFAAMTQVLSALNQAETSLRICFDVRMEQFTKLLYIAGGLLLANGLTMGFLIWKLPR